MKRNLKITLSAVLLTGIIFCGIGSGIIFLEFSGFTYGETLVLGKEQLTTTALTANFKQKKDEPIYLTCYIREGVIKNKTVFIRPDKNIPENQITLELDYNPSAVIISGLTADRHYIDGTSSENFGIDLNVESYYISDEIRNSMDAFHLVLNDIKQKKLNSYQQAGIERCIIHVNPKQADFIRLY